MNREEHLMFCTICTLQKFDVKQGVVCSLTNKQADFENNCPSFEVDEARKLKQANKAIIQAYSFSTASTGKRLANYLIDTIATIILVFLLAFTMGVVLALVAPDALVIFEDDNIFVNYLFSFVAGSIYFLLIEGVTGRSLGKLITNTKVVDMEGNKPDFGTIFVRTLCRFIPFDAFSYLGSDAVGWHDQISKTRVVEIAPQPYSQY